LEVDIMNIYELRKKYNLTQVDVARAIGVSITTVQRWEQEVTNPSEENQKKLEDLKVELKESEGRQ